MSKLQPCLTPPRERPHSLSLNKLGPNNWQYQTLKRLRVVFLLRLTLVICLIVASQFAVSADEQTPAPKKSVISATLLLDDLKRSVIVNTSLLPFKFEQCRDKLSLVKEDTFSQQKIFGTWVQNNLATIYQGNRYFQDGLANSSNLSDGIIGEVTEQWLGYFCTELDLDRSKNLHAFVTDLLESLLIMARLTQTYPDWRDTLSNPLFNDWLEGEAQVNNPKDPACSPLVNCYNTAIEIHDLLDQYYLHGKAGAETIEYSDFPIHYQLNAEDIAYLESKHELGSKLMPLSGQVFAQRYLFEIALNMLGFEHSDVEGDKPVQKKAIIDQAKKSGLWVKDDVKKITWQATEGCGCLESTPVGNAYQKTYYGFQPYWFNNKPELGMAEDVVSTLDFSQISRIGIFSATVKSEPVGNNYLTVPLNWRPERPFSTFVEVAHKHRSKVDLVITNLKPSSAEELSSPFPINYFYDETLIKQINQSIKQPLIDDPINAFKPWLSFGQSPERTLGDGVTLNFDLTELSGEQAHINFKTFIKQLKQTLLTNQIDPEAPVKAKADDAYYLNIMLPAEQLMAGEGFFTMENLSDIAPYVNLFIVTFEPLAQPLASTNSKMGQITAMDKLKHFFAKEPNLKISAELFSKLIPMITAKDEEAGKDIFTHAQMNYLGAAYWSFTTENGVYPAHNKAAQALTSDNAEVVDLSYKRIKNELATVCNIACPHRWLMRVILFCAFAFIVIIAVASLWVYQLKILFTSWRFIIVSGLFSLFLLLVLVCDPYWKQNQEFVVFIFIILTTLIKLVLKVNESKENDLP
jgi:hypothetical protein